MEKNQYNRSSKLFHIKIVELQLPDDEGKQAGDQGQKVQYYINLYVLNRGRKSCMGKPQLNGVFNFFTGFFVFFKKTHNLN